MEQKIIDKTHLLQFSNFELLTTGQRRIFNLSRRRSKRNVIGDNTGRTKSVLERAIPAQLPDVSFFEATRAYLNFFIVHRRDEESNRERGVYSGEWLAII